MSAGIITIDEGSFTLLKYIATLNAADLERTLGFDKGRLQEGFTVVAQAGDERLSADDFSLDASTRYSGGMLRKSTGSDGIGIEEILLERGQEAAALKQKVVQFFATRGGNTPAKVLPNLRHTDGMRYPDAEARGPGKRSGVPQFKLLKPKRFVILRDEK